MRSSIGLVIAIVFIMGGKIAQDLLIAIPPALKVRAKIEQQMLELDCPVLMPGKRAIVSGFALPASALKARPQRSRPVGPRP
jgi:hypothetical protein